MVGIAGPLRELIRGDPSTSVSGLSKGLRPLPRRLLLLQLAADQLLHLVLDGHPFHDTAALEGGVHGRRQVQRQALLRARLLLRRLGLRPCPSRTQASGSCGRASLARGRTLKSTRFFLVLLVMT